MLTSGVAFGDCFRGRRQWLIRPGLKSIGNLLIARRRGRIFPWSIIAIVWTHNTRAAVVAFVRQAFLPVTALETSDRQECLSYLYFAMGEGTEIS